MNECKNCKYWKNVRYLEGECSKIKEKIEIELVVGWYGGYVSSIETQEDFGCNLWEEKIIFN